MFLKQSNFWFKKWIFTYSRDNVTCDKGLDAFKVI